MFRYELHAHTSECDLAAHAGGAALVRRYYEAGYDGMVITDHYFSIFYQTAQKTPRPVTKGAGMAPGKCRQNTAKGGDFGQKTAKIVQYIQNRAVKLVKYRHENF
jgi:histidinol phosphatase-like PHP family hydrolase